jgi:hypothetical protein
MPEDVQVQVLIVDLETQAALPNAWDGHARADQLDDAKRTMRLAAKALEAAYSQKVEPEWEYGVRDYRSPGDGVLVVGPTWDASLREFYGERPLMRRRPATEWEPVQKGAVDDPR